MNSKLLMLLACSACFAQAQTKPTLTPTSELTQAASTASAQTSLNQLTQPSGSVIPNPGRYDPAKLEAVNEIHDYQIKDLATRVSSLESTRTWLLGLAASIPFIFAFVAWLRKEIMYKLLSDVMPRIKVVRD